MNVQRNQLLTGLVVALAGVLAGVVPTASAAPVAVKVNMPNLRCIQNYQMKQTDDDQVYLTVTGVAKGADVNKRLPESGAMEANSKTQPIDAEKPATLWEGELADGEFALLTVTLFHGKGEDPTAKTFATQLADATKGIAERSKKTLAGDDAKKLAAATVKAQQGVVTKVKDTLSREKNTDHYGGLFNILLWNDGGKLVKRLDPVGLTAGEHYGNDEKTYTKIKYTRNNVSVKDENGEYFPQVMPPISEDKQTVRVKMLETERVKVEGKTVPARNVTDYLADIQVEAGGKPVQWKLAGENVGPSEIHMSWDWAE
jgi:hypothetical protein